MDNTPLTDKASLTAAASSSAQGKPLILVVDDQPIIVTVVERYLRDAGFDNVIAVTESRQVVPLLYSRLPDLVVMDLCMPDISGRDILTAMRHDEQLSSIPVIAMTAAAGPRVEQQVRHLGVSHLIRKPLETSEMVDAVRNVLSV